MAIQLILTLAMGATQAAPPPVEATPSVIVRTEVVEITSEGPQTPRIVSNGPPEDAFFNLHKEPRVVETNIGGPPVAVHPNAILASQVVETRLDHGIIDQSITLPAPFRARIPAGSIVMAGMVRGEVRRCLTLGGNPNNPPADERERSMICLVDKEDDGGFETVRVYPDQGRGSPRDFAVNPVRIAPTPAEYVSLGDQRLTQRLRVEKLDGERVFIQVDRSWGVKFSGMDSLFFPAANGNVALPLHEGAQASLAGVILKLERAGDGWAIRTSGSFDRWVSLEEERRRVSFVELGSVQP